MDMAGMPKSDPEQMLRDENEKTSAHQTRGKLKIFFGYASGVGKTYAMLKAAHRAKQQGIDVAAGYIEPHGQPETAALLRGLDQIPPAEFHQGNLTIQEFDLDAALRRKPQLILIDELAHTNADGCRHSKRYQDIEELLKAGIDVHTTLNVQHIESLNDTVASVTGIMVRERIPDSVFDKADQVELADIEPRDLLERMGHEKSCRQRGELETANFFTIENLTALRELALRRCADRMNILSERGRMKNQGEYHTDEHILVCLSSSPSNTKIIRTAARMASAFRGTFTALFVETPGYEEMDEQDKKRLRDNMRLAQQLGATIETVYGDDVPYQIAEFARLSGVSKIVIGRSTATRKRFFSKPTLTERLAADAPNLDIHIIPDSNLTKAYRLPKKNLAKTVLFTLRDMAKSVLLLALATAVGLGFCQLGFTEVNIITVYIFTVLIISVLTTSRLCGLVSSISTVLIFNFVFTEPRFTLQAYDSGYPITFLIMFLASFLTGTLASKLKEIARQSARSAYRTKILLETNQLLQKQPDSEGVIAATANQLIKLLGKNLVIYLTEGKDLSEPRVFWVSEEETNAWMCSEDERAVAEWVLCNNKHAGATTDTLSGARCLYLAIRVNDQVYGVVGIQMDGVPLDSFENSVLLSILGECAMALESMKNAKEKEEAAILAKNEQLRANLLRAISHDLRTPLTSISGNASNLLANYQKLDDTMRQQVFADIYDDSMWLISLVENLLAVTRIEDGRMSLNYSAELMDEVIAEALRHVSRKSAEHIITVHSEEEFLLAQIDVRLIVQVVINIVDNAIKYTPPGSHIEIGMRKRGSMVEVSVADDGPGIPDEAKPRVFDMFYSEANRIVDSRRSLGLGLALCKSIVTAHGGTIGVSDNTPAGTVFTFTLPAGEVELHE